MAPRLSRWVAMTAVAAALVAVMCLTTGGTPLLFTGYGEGDWDWSQRTQVQRRYDAIQQKLMQVRATAEALEFRALLDAALPRTSADPAVFRRGDNGLVAEPALTAELQALWVTLPARRPGVRTVVVIEPRGQSWRFGTAELQPNGVCVVRRMGSDWKKDLSRAIRALAGECFFAESFGPPGRGATEWMRGIRNGLAWESGARVWNPLIREQFEDLGTPVWFQRGATDIYGNGWRNWPVRRAERACLVGRLDRCAEATGVTATGWPGIGPSWGYIGQLFPNSALPRDLLMDVGPDRFGRIWAADAPIAVSYERVVGAPMDRWLGSWAGGYLGSIQRDNGLSLPGWVGTLLWLSLLGLLTAGRLKQRAVT